MNFLEFGAIREPVSRTFYHDEEDGDEDQKLRTFGTSIVEGKIQSTKYLYLSTSPLTTAFVRIHLAKDDSPQVIGDVKVLEKENVKTATFFELTENALLCTVESNSISMDEVNEVASKIIDDFPTDCKIIVLASETMANFLMESNFTDAGGIMRHLKSTYWSSTFVSCPLLEQPNVIGGMPAAVLTLSELQKRPAMILIRYATTNAIDSSQMEGFELIKGEICSSEIEPSQIKRRLKKLASTVETNALYT